MDGARVALLREVLAGTGWLRETRRFAGGLRASLRPHGGGLLLVGAENYEPWHLAAHLEDEAAWSGVPELSPTLVRHRVPAAAPPHLAVDLRRLEAAGRRETVLVVAPQEPGAGLLERVEDARRAGATVLALDSRPEPEPGSHPGRWSGERPTSSALRDLAHDALTADPRELDLDTVQHLVSAAAGEDGLPSAGTRRSFRDRLARLADRLTAPPPGRW